MHCNLRFSVLIFFCLTVGLAGCSHTSPRARPASFNGDVRLADESKDFYSQHRVVTLNGHDLYDRRRVRVKDQRINCLLRDCSLKPGQHTIDIEYFWSSLEAEKKRQRTEAWQTLGNLLGGTYGSIDSRFYPCNGSVTFEVQSAQKYILNVVHADQSNGPEEFQVVETTSGAVVGSAHPSC